MKIGIDIDDTTVMTVEAMVKYGDIYNVEELSQCEDVLNSFGLDSDREENMSLFYEILADAKNENERTVRSGEDAIRQAGRNLLISFRESVTKELNAIIGKNVSSVYSSDALPQLIVKAVECWLSKPEATDISVILSSDDLAKLEESLLAELKTKILTGVTLKANDNFDGGFRIAANGDGAYYDYSKEAVTDMLSNYLSPKITALLKEAE